LDICRIVDTNEKLAGSRTDVWLFTLLFVHFQIKADVETQGEFVKSLIKEVTNAAYKDIEDVVAFVKWLDDELGFLV
jgi:hypothetical protein